MKDDLTGRVVGYSDSYVRHESQLGPDETTADLNKDRTVWAEVTNDQPWLGVCWGVNKHTREDVMISRSAVHTVMPLRQDNEDDDTIPEVGDIVVIDDEADCIVPAGVYQVSKVNSNGSFHVGGNTAVWPRRILEMYEFYEVGSK